MPAAGLLARRIAFNRREARRFRRVAQRLHLRAAEVGQLALDAKAIGQHPRAKRLLNRALAIKAAAVKARLNAQQHRQRMMQLQTAQKLNVKKFAARTVGKRRK